jgi:Uma2 family endonuclease
VSAILTRPVSADELPAMPDDGHRYELVKGELIRIAPAGSEHGEVSMDLAGPLHRHVKEHSLGKVYAAGTGFKLESDPDTDWTRLFSGISGGQETAALNSGGNSNRVNCRG